MSLESSENLDSSSNSVDSDGRTFLARFRSGVFASVSDIFSGIDDGDGEELI